MFNNLEQGCLLSSSSLLACSSSCDECCCCCGCFGILQRIYMAGEPSTGGFSELYTAQVRVVILCCIEASSLAVRSKRRIM